MQVNSILTKEQIATLTNECINEAAKSKAHKRKVGALVVTQGGSIIGRGHNYALDQGPCEDENGKTRDEVIHAEVAALNDCYAKRNDPTDCFIFVTHGPCCGCQGAMKEAKILEFVIVGEFLKFDTNKLRYDLIPPEATKALAAVLTYGAKKYKPNNWKECDDIDRYVAALMRHLEAFRSGEIMDSESGMPHMHHVLTNAAFLTYFGEQKGEQQ